VGKGIVIGKSCKLVPVIFDTIDPAVIGAVQFSGELKIIGWVGENHIDAVGRQGLHRLDAIAGENLVALYRFRVGHGGTMSHRRVLVKKNN
jgi:hypothetical protein